MPCVLAQVGSAIPGHRGMQISAGASPAIAAAGSRRISSPGRSRVARFGVRDGHGGDSDGAPSQSRIPSGDGDGGGLARVAPGQ